MFIEFICVILIMLLVVFITNSIENKRKREGSLISFKESMDLVELPIMTFNCGKTKLNFLMDTGSNISYINSSIVSLLDHKMLETKDQLMGMEGNKIDHEVCELIIQYKENKFLEEFGIVDLEQAFDIIKNESGVQIHGVLGSKFFEKYKYILNFAKLVAYKK